jgi:NitT/TauT family transport system substrate-binding protein
LQLSWLNQAQFAGFYVAQQKGYYAAEGLDVQILPGGPNVTSIQQIGAGAADFAIDSVLALYQARDAGVDVIAVAQADQTDFFVMLSRKSSGITTAQDFRGKKVGVFPDEWEFNALMGKLGMTAGTDFTLVQQGFTMDPFISGQLDVASASLANEYNVLLEGSNPPFKASDLNVIRFEDYGVSVPHDTLLTSNAFVTAHHDAAVAFIRASIKGWKDAYSNQSSAIDTTMNIIQANTAQSARQHQELMLQAMQGVQLPNGLDPSQWGKFDPAVYLSVAQIANSYLKLSKPVDAAAAYRTDLWEAATK